MMTFVFRKFIFRVYIQPASFFFTGQLVKDLFNPTSKGKFRLALFVLNFLLSAGCWQLLNFLNALFILWCFHVFIYFPFSLHLRKSGGNSNQCDFKFLKTFTDVQRDFGDTTLCVSPKSYLFVFRRLSHSWLQTDAVFNIWKLSGFNS